MSEENKKTPYVSKKGFEEAHVLRGWTEIKHLHNILKRDYGDCAFICGGYVRYMCSPKQHPATASDVDVYCMNEETFNAVKEMLTSRLTIRYENEISITFVRPKEIDHIFFASPPIQLIKPVVEGKVVACGSMQEVLENFDFTVIRGGLISENKALVDADFMHDEENQILRLKNIHCPISSTLRCMKYSRKGYWLPAFQCLRLFLDWDGRDAEYRDKLVDFLQKANQGNGLSREEIDELEALMRID